MTVNIRPAEDADEMALAALDRVCWSVLADVSPPSPPGAAFFGDGRKPGDVLVAEDAGVIVGWAKLAPPTPLPSNDHVQQVQGLAVDPARHRAGIARALLDAAIELARRRGARKVSLRVLGSNEPAQRLYRSAGFVVEGVLRAEFFLADRYVDDLLLAMYMK